MMSALTPTRVFFYASTALMGIFYYADNYYILKCSQLDKTIHDFSPSSHLYSTFKYSEN